jgi:hypothetical protein
MCCGQLVFKLKFNVESQQLVVRVLRVNGLPPKDAGGSAQDIGVKCYLLPDKKKKFQTKVHTAGMCLKTVFLDLK